MTKSLPVTLYVYAYFSQYASPGDAPQYMARMYETTDSNYVLVDTYARELEFEVPENVAEYTPARLAAFAARKAAIQLAFSMTWLTALPSIRKVPRCRTLSLSPKI